VPCGVVQLKSVNIFRALILLFVGIEVVFMIALSRLNLSIIWFVTLLSASGIGFGTVVVVALARILGVRLRHPD